MKERCMLVQNWLAYEVILHWVGVGFYIAATVIFTYGVFFKKGNSNRYAIFLTIAGIIPHSAALCGRWIVQEHGPYMTRYEVLSSDAWITIVMFLVLAAKWPKLSSAGMIIIPTAFLMIALGLFMNPSMSELPPSLRSVWLIMHVSFAKMAAGAMILALASAVLFLLKEKARNPIYDRILTLEALDEYSYKFFGFGFIFWTINIVAGSIWAHQSWGRYWAWDPIETWSLITWLMYGMFAHLRVFWKWRGRKSAIFLTGCFVMSMFTIFILPFVAKSLHSEYFIK